MGIDAIIQSVPDGQSGKSGNGMDCMKSNENVLKNAESCLSGNELQLNANFLEAYKKIAQSNIHSSIETDKKIDDEMESNDVLCCDFVDEPILFEDEAIINCTNFEVASDLIRNALSGISNQLDLLTCDPDKFNLSNVTESTIEQFAEIIHVLKQIVTALEGSPSKEGIQGDAIDSNETVNLVSNLRIEQFKIEMATQLLGVAAEVQNAVALKAEQVFASGISQAINPMNVKMPIDQIKKLFGNIVSGTEKNEVVDGVKSDGLKISTENGTIENKKVLSVQQFDSSTYRKLLKVDVDSSTQNKPESVSGIDTSKSQSIVSESVMVQSLNEGGLEKNPDMVIPDSSLQMKSPAATENIQVPLLTATKNTTEDVEVVKQIISKFHTISRAGSSEVKIQLRPESLGEVKIHIRMEREIVAAKIIVESQQVRQIVENNIQTLKDSLSQQNLIVTSIDVNVGREGMEGETANWEYKESKSAQQDTDKTLTDTNSDNDNQEKHQLLTGRETGGRYGTNSIEYFA